MSFTYPVPYVPPDEVLPGLGGQQTGVGDPGANGYMSRISHDVSVARTFQAGGGISVTNADGVEGDTVIAVNYQVFIALLTQSGTDAPTAIVLENTLEGTVVFGRAGVGHYTATLAGAFRTNKTVVFMTGNGISQFGTIASYLFNTEDVLLLKTFDAGDSFAPVDGRMVGTTLEIRVYP